MAAVGGIYWAHSDSQDLSAWARRAVELGAKGAAWPDGDEGNRLFRAWLCSYLATIANLGPSPVTQLVEQQGIAGMPPGLTGPGARYLIEPKKSASETNLEIQNLLAVALAALASQGKYSQAQMLAGSPDFPLNQGTGKARGLRTVDGGAVEVLEAQTTAFLPVLGWVVVSVLGLAAAGVAYLVGSQVNETRALGITQEGKTTQAIAAMSTATSMIEMHQQREKEAGASMPYDAQEQALLGTLRKTITDVAGWQPPVMKTLPDVDGASKRIGSGLGFGSFAILAVGAYLLLREGNKQSSRGRLAPGV